MNAVSEQELTEEFKTNKTQPEQVPGAVHGRSVFALRISPNLLLIYKKEKRIPDLWVMKGRKSARSCNPKHSKTLSSLKTERVFIATCFYYTRHEVKNLEQGDRLVTISEYSSSSISQPFQVPAPHLEYTGIDKSEELAQKCYSIKKYGFGFCFFSLNIHMWCFLSSDKKLRFPGTFLHQVVNRNHQMDDFCNLEWEMAGSMLIRKNSRQNI